MEVLVTGGTGRLGRQVVKLLRRSGHRARIYSRHPRGHVDAIRGDLRSGTGLAQAVARMEVVIHLASATRNPLAGRSVDVSGTRRLLEVARQGRVRHIVYVSIVGIDGVGYPYYRTKLAAEEVVREGVVPWSILRTTQFHEFIEFMLGGFSRVPGVLAVPFDWQLQPVDTGEVASRVVDIALGEPEGNVADFGGPEIRTFKSLAQSWLEARKEGRRLINLRLPFQMSRQLSEGRLTSPDHKDGKVTFDRYLEEKYRPC